MTTTVEALKEIYVSLGGELTDTYDDIAGGVAVGDYVTIPDVSNAIAQRAASAGIELPSVSAADNGKVLSVVDGKWAAKEASTEPDTVWFLLPSSLSTVSKITMNGEEITVADFVSYIIGLPVEKRLAVHWYISAQGPGNANSNGTGFYVSSSQSFDVTAVSQSGYFVKISLNKNGTATVTTKQITMS